MKLLKRAVFLSFIYLYLSGCTVEPKPIPYGEANCAHCNMTVSDNRYGAELVNDKGKPYFFDSAECLAAYIAEQPEADEKASYMLVSDFTDPGQLIDSQQAHFLQSEALPSPMGMNLTAVADEATAKQMQQEYGGQLLDWDQVLLAVKNDDRFR